MPRSGPVSARGNCGDHTTAAIAVEGKCPHMPGLRSETRLRFAGLERGKELVVGQMVGVVRGAEERAPSIDGGWRGKARFIIWLHGSFEVTARLDADELTRAFDRDPNLANAQGWASEQARYPGLVEYRVRACDAILPWAFTQYAPKAFDAGAKKLEFDIDVCLWATGKTSSSWSPYEWLIVSWGVDGQAFRLRAGRPMTVSPREVLRPRQETASSSATRRASSPCSHCLAARFEEFVKHAHVFLGDRRAEFDDHVAWLRLPILGEVGGARPHDDPVDNHEF